MKAQDLRYKNYVNRVFDSPKKPNDKEIIQIGQVNGIHNTYCCLDDCIGSLKELEPIKLTEAYLIGLGFEITEYKNFWGQELYLKGISIYIENNEVRFYYHTNRAWTIYEYVHEIQNLYHTLTGKELEYKPL